MWSLSHIKISAAFLEESLHIITKPRSYNWVTTKWLEIFLVLAVCWYISVYKITKGRKQGVNILTLFCNCLSLNSESPGTLEIHQVPSMYIDFRFKMLSALDSCSEYSLNPWLLPVKKLQNAVEFHGWVFILFVNPKPSMNLPSMLHKSWHARISLTPFVEKII